MKKNIIFIMVFVLLLSGSVKSATQKPDVDAPIYILIEQKTGQILCQKNSRQKHPPASTLKVLTAIIAIEEAPLDQIMTASNKAVADIGVNGSNIGIMSEEEIPFEALLNAMLIKSGNETANIIAENISSSRDEFVSLMNKKALEIGAVDSNFENPSGLPAKNQYTTAYDMALISKYAMNNSVFRQTVKKKAYNMPPTNKHNSWDVLMTTNKLLFKKMDKENYRITGIKTGYTNESGFNLVASAKNPDDVELICVLMGLDMYDANNIIFENAIELFDYGFEDFSLQEVEKNKREIKKVHVENSKADVSIPVYTSSELNYFLPNDKDKWGISVEEFLFLPIVAPVNEGDVLGRLTYEKNGKIIGKVDIIAMDNVEKSFSEKLKEFIFDTQFLKYLKYFLIIIAFFILLRITLKRISNKVNRHRK